MSSVATSDGQTFLLFDDIRLDRLYHPVCDLINSKSHQKLGWNKVTWRFQFLNRFIMRTHGFLTINLSHRKTCRSVSDLHIFDEFLRKFIYKTENGTKWLFSKCSELFGPFLPFGVLESARHNRATLGGPSWPYPKQRPWKESAETVREIMDFCSRSVLQIAIRMPTQPIRLQ